jgi:hypothetical protein
MQQAAPLAGQGPYPGQPPIQQVQPQVAVGPVPVPHLQPTTYHELYLRPGNDIFRGNYANLYNEYTVGNTGPAELRGAVYRDGNTGTHLHILCHVRPNNADPDDPGVIVAYHRMTIDK